MRPVKPEDIDAFARAFTFGRRGFSADEIPTFFSQYQGGVPASPRNPMGTKSDFFRDCVSALTPVNQWSALLDLCDSPPPSKHRMPTAKERLQLRARLVQGDGRSDLAVALSEVSLGGVRAQWLVACSRLPESPAAAITAGRALLETTCKSVLKECGVRDESAGDLPRLYKQTRVALELEVAEGSGQAVHQIASGLTAVVAGLSGLSNQAGDRHGLAEGLKIDDLALASLAVHGAGCLALFLARVHRERRMPKAAEPLKSRAPARKKR